MSQQASTQTSEGKGRSGKTVLLALFAGLLVLVPLLLSGRARLEQVSLDTLEQRSGTVWRIGTFDLGGMDWEPRPGWPEPSPHIELPPGLARNPSESPAGFHLPAIPAPRQTHWATASRTMPLAFVVPIENRRALSPGQRDILDVRLLAARVLDPDREEDRADLGFLADALLTGYDGKYAGGRRARRSGPTAGEQLAGRLIQSYFQALDSDDPAGSFRKAIRQESIRAMLSETATDGEAPGHGG